MDEISIFLFTIKNFRKFRNHIKSEEKEHHAHLFLLIFYLKIFF